MSPKKDKQTVSKMEAKVDALESELVEMRASLAAVTTAVKDLPTTLVSMLEKSMGKSVTMDGESVNRKQGEPSWAKMVDLTGEKSDDGKFRSLHDEAFAEFRQSAKKVELPMFSGEDPAGWISRAEVYFRVQGTLPEVKVSLSQLSMEGPTIHFFNSLLEADPALTWEKFREALLERYGGHGEGDVYEQLTELRQRGSIDEYITEFEYLTAQIPRLPDKQYQGYFLHGLKEEIRGKVRSLSVMGGLSRSKLLTVARVVEKEVRGENGSGFTRGTRSNGSGYKSGATESGKVGGNDWIWVKGGQGQGPTVKPGTSGPKVDQKAQNEPRRNGPRDRGFSHLTYQELLERK